MHELSICQNIIEIIKEQAQKNDFSQVKTILLEIGAFATIEKSALLFAFPIAAKNSVAEKAKLKIIDIPGKVYCDNCNKNVTLSHRYDPCNDCGQLCLTVIQGDELRIKQLEVN